MKGKTCGICGRGDGEMKQEYQTPNGYVAEDYVSFAHSWIIPGEGCGTSESNVF